MDKISLRNMTRNELAKVINVSLANVGEVKALFTLFSGVRKFFTIASDYVISDNLYDAMAYRDAQLFMNLTQSSTTCMIWHKGNRKMFINREDWDSYCVFDAASQDYMFVTDNAEQFATKIWELVETVIVYFGDDDYWEEEIKPAAYKHIISRLTNRVKNDLDY